MKKQLLLIILPILLFSVSVQAQTKVWNFSDESVWPISDGIATAQIVDKLTLEPHPTSTKLFGQVDGSSQSFSDGFSSTNRFKVNGGSGATGALPTARFFKFIVKGDVSIKVWLKSGGGSERTFYVSDGINVLAEATKFYDDTAGGVAEDGDPFILTASYTGADSDIYLYDSNNFSVYKIEVSGPGASDLVLSTNNAVSQVSTNVKAIGNQIHVSNVKLATAINIYSITGALVKTVEVSNDTSFSLKSGLYIATVKTAEGQKSVKLVLR
ncbi:T9SS type A sorting domain-containing protein [Tamlana sp. I1]|uniref:T9SS type A sorting domain-containing protein n=1 Tax=Tamlana sp. I1 TaxID=2762061 RepID=UPI00189058C1|nr:T9SS type A sorting domain-containing protein [Tamlana sp. I1]